jgi:hypothetical protein
VLAWRVSNTLDSGFCVDCLEQVPNVNYFLTSVTTTL